MVDFKLPYKIVTYKWDRFEKVKHWSITPSYVHRARQTISNEEKGNRGSQIHKKAGYRQWSGLSIKGDSVQKMSLLR